MKIDASYSKYDFENSKRKNSEDSIHFKSRDFLNDETLKNLQKAKRRSSRIATEGDNP
jgi:hypothetical protein